MGQPPQPNFIKICGRRDKRVLMILFGSGLIIMIDDLPFIFALRLATLCRRLYY